MKLVIAALACFGSVGSWADSLTPGDALKQLIERHEAQSLPGSGSTVRAAVTAPLKARRTENLQAGETLDGLIRRTWPGLPSKDIWVRKAYVDLNPSAFVQGNPNLLKPGVSLIIPGREELRASFKAAQPQIAALFDTPEPTQSSSQNTHHDRPVSSRWVRYP
jgi:Tfp pilus assembly protein FimV